MLTHLLNAFRFGKGKYIDEIEITIVFGTCSLELWSGPPEITDKTKMNKKSNKYIQ